MAAIDLLLKRLDDLQTEIRELKVDIALIKEGTKTLVDEFTSNTALEAELNGEYVLTSQEIPEEEESSEAPLERIERLKNLAKKRYSYMSKRFPAHQSIFVEAAKAIKNGAKKLDLTKKYGIPKHYLSHGFKYLNAIGIYNEISKELNEEEFNRYCNSVRSAATN